MSLALCRACLTENARMQIRNTEFRDVYEKLSNSKLVTEDGRSESVCYNCYSQLQRCYNFSVMTQRANDMLTQHYCNGVEILQADVDTLQEILSLDCIKDSQNPLESNVMFDSIKKECDSVKVELIEFEESFNEDIKLEDLPMNNDIVVKIEAPKKPIQKKKPESKSNSRENKSKSNPQKQTRRHVIKQENTPANKSNEICDVKSESNEKELDSDFTKQVIDGNDCKASNTQISSQEHLTEYHTEKSFNCDKCPKTFQSRNSLKTHLRIHNRQKSSVCDRCGKAFQSAYQLKRHIRTHTGERPHKCVHCSKSFSDLGNLTKHLVYHQKNNRPYNCTECNASFSLKSNLQRHFRSHTGETPFLCDICQKSFPDASLLKRHIRIHTGETPYLCNTCGKAYSDKDNFKCHMRRHTGVKPFSCKLCEFKCAHAYSLKYHMAKKHT